MNDAAKPMTASEREALIAVIRSRYIDVKPIPFPVPADAVSRLLTELSRLGKIEERGQEVLRTPSFWFEGDNSQEDYSFDAIPVCYLEYVLYNKPIAKCEGAADDA